MSQAEIDALFERYLGLLDSYVNLQQEVGRLHSAVFQNLARANFSAERGVRFGQDYYDERMQALRGLKAGPIHADSADGFLKYEVVHVDEDEPTGETAEVESKKNRVGESAESKEKPDVDAGEDGEKESQQHKKPSKDPLRWFGILTPLPLRQAQQHAVESVENLIPRLATLSSEMASIELEIRRTRKKRAKSEKLKQHGEHAARPDSAEIAA